MKDKMDSTFNPDSTARARGALAVCLVFMVIATCGIALRMYSKFLKRNRLSLDDYTLFIGLIFYYISAILTVLQVQIGGLGHQLSEVEQYPDRLIKMGKLGVYGQYPYALAMAFIRWSICILFLKIFVGKATRISLWTCVVANAIWIVFNILIVSLRCFPYSKNWNAMEQGKCLPQIPIVSVIAGTGVAIELVMWIIPIPAVWNLNMVRKKKVALTCVFGLGIIDIAIGLARLFTVVFVNESNLSWSEVAALELIAVEPSVAIVVASLCVCHPLLDQALASRWISSIRSMTSSLLRSKSSSNSYKDTSTSSESTDEYPLDLVPKENVNSVSATAWDDNSRSKDIGNDVYVQHDVSISYQSRV